MIANVLPSSTASPSLILISRTVPAHGASTGISIFIDSKMMTVSPSFTLLPGFASIFQTVPVMCALTSVATLAPRSQKLLDDFTQLRRHRGELQRRRQTVDEAEVALGVLRQRTIEPHDDRAVAVAAGV